MKSEWNSRLVGTSSPHRSHTLSAVLKRSGIFRVLRMFASFMENWEIGPSSAIALLYIVASAVDDQIRNKFSTAMFRGPSGSCPSLQPIDNTNISSISFGIGQSAPFIEIALLESSELGWVGIDPVLAGQNAQLDKAVSVLGAKSGALCSVLRVRCWVVHTRKVDTRGNLVPQADGVG
jgi:hypothetical protein